jgi:hypothetical protein
MSTSHEPFYSEDGMPKDRYRLRWPGLFGQFDGRDKLGSDFAHAANLGISVSSIAS